jgi:hypothetical protein
MAKNLKHALLEGLENITSLAIDRLPATRAPTRSDWFVR